MAVRVESGDADGMGVTTRPYAPSWVDQVAASVERLPGRWWVWYLVVALLLAVLVQGMATGRAASPTGTAHVRLLLGALLIPYCLGLMHYLNQQAVTAFERFRPALQATDEERAALRYQLEATPRAATLGAGLAGATFALLMWFGARPLILDLLALPASGTLTTLGGVIYVVAWAVLGTLFFHLVHQLRIINDIYARYTRIVLANLEPLYAFSNFTFRAALGVGVLCLSQLVVGSEILLTTPGVLVALLLGLTVIATFALPLLGIHYRIADEKQRALADVSARRQRLLAELHRRVDSDQISGMDDLQMASQMVDVEYASLSLLPTWPWPRDTLRNLVATLLLPFVLWLIQQLIQPLLMR